MIEQTTWMWRSRFQRCLCSVGEQLFLVVQLIILDNLFKYIFN